MDWRITAQHEIAMARSALEEGNKGRMRVCARRAAGAAAREFLSSKGMQPGQLSALQSLHALAFLPDLSPDVRLAACNLVLPVNRHHTLPVDVDLIQEAVHLCELLFPGSNVWEKP